MAQGRQSPDEGLLSWVERWSPADAELWTGWRRSLSSRQRSEVLLPLQAALSGLIAFRHLENHPRTATVADFRPQLEVVQAAYAWALELTGDLRGGRTPERRLRSVDGSTTEPQASLRALERSLTDALRVADRLLGLTVVDAGAFQASVDLFLRDLDRNAFFRPPEPLEFTNVSELIGPEHFPEGLDSWKSDAAKTTTIVAFLTLLRNHRFLGIADRQIQEAGGVNRAHIILAAVRKELRTLTRFLLVQGVETFADELEARLLSLDAEHITGARTAITAASRELRDLRDTVETIAMDVHGRVRSAIEEPISPPDALAGPALAAERMRSGIRELKVTIKDAARDLRDLALHAPVETEPRQSERVRRSVHQDVWAFRFILRAFVAKASAVGATSDSWSGTGDRRFVSEFVRHFRVFGPRLASRTEYPRRDALARSVGALARREEIDGDGLAEAVRECDRFATHLDEVFDGASHSMLAPFDKHRAASELRGYLAAARDRSVAERAAAAAFGLIDGGRAEAG